MIVDQEELESWGRSIGGSIRPPVFLALRGALGAGKSVLARAVAQGAGIDDAMPSPTFNLVFRYTAAGGVRVVHMDLYRLESPEELWELGWEELGLEAEIVLLEWPERAGDLLPADRWEIQLEVPERGQDLGGPRELYRRVSVNRHGHPPPLPGFPIRVAG